MIITIGELVGDITPYAGRVEVSVTNGIPFLRTNLISSNYFTKVYLYIAQVDEYKYTACDDPDDVNGNIYFPYGTIDHPLVKEKELARSWFCNPTSKIDECSCSMMRNVNREKFLIYFYQLLMEYNLIKISEKSYKTPMNALGFSNIKIRRRIEESFIDVDMNRNSHISDLVKSVNIHKHPFSLSGLKDREVQYVIRRLNDIGLRVDIRNNLIHQIYFEKVI
jgi:hypothetical protein